MQIKILNKTYHLGLFRLGSLEKICFRSYRITQKRSGGVNASSSSIPCIKSKTKTSNTSECKKRLMAMKELLLTGYFCSINSSSLYQQFSSTCSKSKIIVLLIMVMALPLIPGIRTTWLTVFKSVYTNMLSVSGTVLRTNNVLEMHTRSNHQPEPWIFLRMKKYCHSHKLVIINAFEVELGFKCNKKLQNVSIESERPYPRPPISISTKQNPPYLTTSSNLGLLAPFFPGEMKKV
ncbi:Uncharacterized protein FWK35_00013483 [Aphis craccivora]|uniref:Uncharacterized protein n=1 Tax=Aphis craccivora TaxID=307492 RepID=A0A6G0YE28_APHCR|nr:Uncharacterized protein FWK35_00013483 [Aphis craccivora]